MAWYFNIPAQPTPSVGFLWQPTIAGTNKFDLFDFTECEFYKLNLQATDPLLGAQFMLLRKNSNSSAICGSVFESCRISSANSPEFCPKKWLQLRFSRTCPILSRHSWSVRFACALRDGSTTTEVLPWTLGLLVYVVLAFQLLTNIRQNYMWWSCAFWPISQGMLLNWRRGCGRLLDWALP